MKKGFTFIELIVVITILLVLSAAAIVNYNSYTNRERVRQLGLNLKSDLRFAVSKANSGIKPSSCSSTTLSSYDVSFIKSCAPEGLSCYKIAPRCSDPDGLVVADQMIVTLPKEVFFQSADQTIHFLPLSAGVSFDAGGDSAAIVITSTSVDQPLTITISSSGIISN